MDVALLEHQHGLKARNYAAEILENWEDAEDVVLEAETRIATRYPTHPQAAGYNMLMRATQRLCVDMLRKRSRHVKTHPLDKLSELITDGTTPEGEVLAQEWRDTIKSAVCDLPPKSFSVIVMRYWHGWSYATIAQVSKVKPGTVKSQLWRAREMLREKLQEVSK